MRLVLLMISGILLACTNIWTRSTEGRAPEDLYFCRWWRKVSRHWFRFTFHATTQVHLHVPPDLRLRPTTRPPTAGPSVSNRSHQAAGRQHLEGITEEDHLFATLQPVRCVSSCCNKKLRAVLLYNSVQYLSSVRPAVLNTHCLS